MSEEQVKESVETNEAPERSDNTKNEIAGLNRKISELQDELNGFGELQSKYSTLLEEKKASMSEVELKELRLQELDTKVNSLTNELTTIKTEKTQQALNLYKIEKMNEAGIDAAFSEFVTGGSQEEIDLKIAKFNEKLSQAQLEVKAKLVDQSGPKSGSKDSGEMSQEKFNSLSLAERTKLYKDNPDYYSKFLKY